MDYKEKIKHRWPTDKELTEWLELHYEDWRENDPGLVSDFILRSILGAKEHGEMDTETANQAEDWIMETYLGA